MKQLIGLEETATPNDAFLRITLGNKRYGINLYVKYQDGTPASSITVTSSAKPPISGSMTTDSNDYLFLAQDSTSFTASIDNAGGKLYIDLEENPSISTTLSQTITTINLVWKLNENVIKIDTSKTVTFSASVKTFDACAVGGGGGGYAYISSRSLAEATGENGGQDGSDGEGREPGTGCGKSTTVDGIKYCSGAGGLAYNRNADSEGIGQPGYGAGAGVITTNIDVTNTAHDGTLPGAAGGNVIVSGRLSGSNNVSFKSSSGADGIVIFKWTT